ncbi:MAG: hypothetical protein KBT47_01590 [Armatimonadetes bacterium]|nr:hypothetical protein [Candidatus Hippobium faecium]
MKYFMGIDAGGTKCETVICDEAGHIAGRGICYGTEITAEEKGSGGMGRSPEAMFSSFMKAYENIPENAQLYITYNQSLPVLEKFLKDKNINYRALYAADEPEAIYNAANIEKGYLALVGTGAFGYYYNCGKRFYFDGLGPNLGDFGSGFYIGYKAVKAVAISEWDEKYRTSLAPILNKVILGKEYNNYGSDLVRYYIDMPSRNEVAKWTKYVNEEAEKGDRISIEILKEAGRNFGNTMRCLVKNVRPCEEKLPIICAGGVMTGCRYFREAFIEYCNENIENEVRMCPLSSVYGNVFKSAKQAGVEDTDRFYSNLLKNSK